MVTHRIAAMFMCCLFAVSFLHAQAGFTAGTEYGIGVVARAGTHDVMFEVGGGLAPLFFFAQVTYGDDITKLWFPFTAGAKLSFGISKPDEPNRLGVKAGVSYNGILKTGFGGGVDYEISQAPRVVLAGGFMYYPQAKKSVVEKLNDEDGTSYTEESLTATLLELQPIVSISIIF
jgi:hypothetical protein